MSAESIFDEIDEERLEKAQTVRQKIIAAMTNDGQDIPESQSDRLFLLQALDGSDKSVFAKSKIRVESRAAADQKQQAAFIGELLMRHRVVDSSARTEIPLLPDDITVDDAVVGEMDIGVSNLNYETFINR